MYELEHGNREQFSSIPDSIYWATVTIVRHWLDSTMLPPLPLMFRDQEVAKEHLVMARNIWWRDGRKTHPLWNNWINLKLSTWILDVEQEMADIAVLHQIGLAFDTKFSGLPDGCFRLEFFQIGQ